MDNIAKWCDDWGMIINVKNTKIMMFTHRRIPTPEIILNNNVEFVKEFQFLGVTFDAPQMHLE